MTRPCGRWKGEPVSRKGLFDILTVLWEYRNIVKVSFPLSGGAIHENGGEFERSGIVGKNKENFHEGLYHSHLDPGLFSCQSDH
jgi:hypothetical protein